MHHYHFKACHLSGRTETLKKVGGHSYGYGYSHHAASRATETDNG